MAHEQKHHELDDVALYTLHDWLSQVVASAALSHKRDVKFKFDCLSLSSVCRADCSCMELTPLSFLFFYT